MKAGPAGRRLREAIWRPSVPSPPWSVMTRRGASAPANTPCQMGATGNWRPWRRKSSGDTAAPGSMKLAPRPNTASITGDRGPDDRCSLNRRPALAHGSTCGPSAQSTRSGTLNQSLACNATLATSSDGSMSFDLLYDGGQYRYVAARARVDRCRLSGQKGSLNDRPECNERLGCDRAAPLAKAQGELVVATRDLRKVIVSAPYCRSSSGCESRAGCCSGPSNVAQVLNAPGLNAALGENGDEPRASMCPNPMEHDPLSEPLRLRMRKYATPLRNRGEAREVRIQPRHRLEIILVTNHKNFSERIARR